MSDQIETTYFDWFLRCRNVNRFCLTRLKETIVIIFDCNRCYYSSNISAKYPLDIVSCSFISVNREYLVSVDYYIIFVHVIPLLVRSRSSDEMESGKIDSSNSWLNNAYIHCYALYGCARRGCHWWKWDYYGRRRYFHFFHKYPWERCESFSSPFTKSKG